MKEPDTRGLHCFRNNLGSQTRLVQTTSSRLAEAALNKKN